MKNVIKAFAHRIQWVCSPKIFRRQTIIRTEKCGHFNSNFHIATSRLKNVDSPVVYSFGVGTDIAFDLAMMKKYSAEIFAFDPTPKSINWLKKQDIPSGFHFFPYGLGLEDGIVKFYLPKNDDYVSGSMVLRDDLCDQAVDVEMKSFISCVKLGGHEHIDVLKMDIEGTEYDIIDSILDSGIPIDQICMEVHGRMIVDGVEKTKELLSTLNKHGYKVAHVTLNQEDVLFVKEK